MDRVQVKPERGVVGGGGRRGEGRLPGVRPGEALRLQGLVGNAAVARMVVQRVGEKKPLDEVLAGTDAGLLREHRPFGAISVEQGRRICRLVLDHSFLWVGRDEEITLESAWRAMYPYRDSLGEQDWALWKECAEHGAEIKYIPWMNDLRTGFADRVRERAVGNVEANVRAIEGEAKRLGVALDGGPATATAESDAAIAEQKQLAQQIKDAQARLGALRKLNVGYGPPQPGAERDGDNSPVGGSTVPVPKPLVTFDPERPPAARSTPDPAPELGIANYEAVLAVHTELTQVTARILNKNPALYALAARGGTDPLLQQDTNSARKALTAALKDVLANATTTKGDIQSRALDFAEMTPVHRQVLAADSSYQKLFPQKLAADHVQEHAEDAAAGSKLVGLVTLALIVAVEVGSVGTATPVVAAVISLASSTGTAAASWNDWAKLETAAKSTVTDENSVVAQGQADDAMLSALMATAMALVDVYGLGKAARASTQAVKALEAKVADALALKGIARGATVGAKEAIERSVTSLGPAATVRNVGSWQKILSAVGPESAAMGKIVAWRDGVFRSAEEIAMKATGASREELARAALATASGIGQAAVGEALDAVIEIIGGGESTTEGHIGVGGKVAEVSIEAAAASVPKVAARTVQRVVEVVNVPYSELKLATMSSAEFEHVIRYGVASGYFAAHGLPRMTVIDAKLHGGGHGYDGLGVSKQGDLIKLYNLECKHVAGDSNHIPTLGATAFGTQGGLRWSDAKAATLLSADNPFAEETYDALQKAVKRRLGPGIPFSDHALQESLGGALRSAEFNLFLPVWAQTEHIVAQMRGLARSGVKVGTLFRIAPRKR
ncbi:hypothetical protein Aglo03_25250 [Actinokineospora globicatena]|uniref:Uncharacterized protein n=1 Tax=Actinokineospora globicatena TaxID=103729 RepID=A0A9W6QND4_9PSEU|nr:hypothetical protein Aglo03_25250 [Actinokineospora globicatena]